MELERQVSELLKLRMPPIAVGFLDAAPAGVDKWEGGEVAAGCVFWKKAMEGASFYTVASDHYNCALGCHTHAIPLPEARAQELPAAINFMCEAGYLRMDEVPGIPVLSKTPAAVAYAPAGAQKFNADVVLMAVNPAQAMLAYEAAIRAGAGAALMNVLGRPACAVLPMTAGMDQAGLSFGCKGNRSFTGLPDDEMYIAVPGKQWEAVARAIIEACESNAAMGKFYQGRKKLFRVA